MDIDSLSGEGTQPLLGVLSRSALMVRPPSSPVGRLCLIDSSYWPRFSTHPCGWLIAAAHAQTRNRPYNLYRRVILWYAGVVQAADRAQRMGMEEVHRTGIQEV